MTASPKPKKLSPFKVVPPQEHSLTPTNAGQSMDSDLATPSSSKLAKPPFRVPWCGLLLVGGMAALGFVPTPYQVGGEVTLEWPEGDRQEVRAPRRATIEAFYVQPGDAVQVGQPLLQLFSLELDQEIAELEQEIARAHEQLRGAEQEQLQAEAQYKQAIALAQTTRVQANRIENRFKQLQQGTLTPEIQGLVAQQERLLGQQQQAQLEWERYQALYEADAVALADVEAKEASYANIERDLRTKQAEINLAQQRLEDTVFDEVSAVAYQEASAAASQQVAVYGDRIVAQREILGTLHQQLAKLQHQRENLVLLAQQSGTVLDQDLDLKIGQEVTPADVLLNITELDRLTANVQVKEEDSNYVEVGAEVTFRPTSAKLTPYNATVDKILPNVEPDPTQLRRIATVRLVIDNPDQRLQPGSSGYAKIFSEWIPLYQRLGREIVKLVPSKFL